MTRVVLDGVQGANPLGFLAALGLLRVADRESDHARLGFLDDGSFRAFLDLERDVDLAEIVALDAQRSSGPQPWRVEYEKVEKNGIKRVADLKAPPDQFRAFLSRCVEAWRKGVEDAVDYAAAFGTDVAVDGKGNTKPTAFHFTAANQQFLGAVEEIRASVTMSWAKSSIFEGHAARPGSNLRWDPDAERNRALMAENPVDRGTVVDAPLEWLAFRGLPMFPTVPRGDRILTTCVEGRGDGMRMRWPLWSAAASVRTVSSVLRSACGTSPDDRRLRGIFAVCVSSIRRTSQGFGNFGPAEVSA